MGVRTLLTSTLLIKKFLLDFKLQASYTAMLSKGHFTCCWKYGISMYQLSAYGLSMSAGNQDKDIPP